MLPDLEPFLSRVRALFPDTRGHGLSEKFGRAEDYTYPKKCLDLRRLLRESGATSPRAPGLPSCEGLLPQLVDTPRAL